MKTKVWTKWVMLSVVSWAMTALGWIYDDRVPPSVVRARIRAHDAKMEYRRLSEPPRKIIQAPKPAAAESVQKSA